MDWLGPVFWLVVPVIFIGLFVWRIRQRAYQMRDLVERGRPVTGEILEKLNFNTASGTRNRYLRYRFRAGDGQWHTYKIAVSTGDYKNCEPGDPIELVYLPDKPSVSAAVDMVELVRDAMEKRDAKKAGKGG